MRPSPGPPWPWPAGTHRPVGSLALASHFDPALDYGSVNPPPTKELQERGLALRFVPGFSGVEPENSWLSASLKNFLKPSHFLVSKHSEGPVTGS